MDELITAKVNKSTLADVETKLKITYASKTELV